MAKFRTHFPDIVDFKEWCRLCDIMEALPADKISYYQQRSQLASDKAFLQERSGCVTP
jgi:hypothetical protein